MKDVVVEGPTPQMMIGAAVHAQLDALEVNDQGDCFWDMVSNMHGLTNRACEPLF